MARPVKQGLDYFPLDVALDKNFRLIEAEFGLKGFAIIVKLFQMIYGECGYYCEWNAEVVLLFSQGVGEGRNTVSEIVNRAIHRGIFDKDKFETYGILTSAGIQRRYVNGKKGCVLKLRSEYLLISAPENTVFYQKTEVSPKETGVFQKEMPQRKEKENKENYIYNIYNADSDKKNVDNVDKEGTIKFDAGEYMRGMGLK